MEYDILVVDDEESIRNLFAAILRNNHYSVSTAASGPEALELLERNTFRLILLDLRMPGMSGTEVFREIRKQDQDIPVYFVTAFQHEYFEELNHIHEVGMKFELLRKPLEKEQLLTAVDSVLR